MNKNIDLEHVEKIMNAVDVKYPTTTKNHQTIDELVSAIEGKVSKPISKKHLEDVENVQIILSHREVLLDIKEEITEEIISLNSKIYDADKKRESLNNEITSLISEMDDAYKKKESLRKKQNTIIEVIKLLNTI